MAVDLQRILQAAAAAALDDPASGETGPRPGATSKRRSRGPRAFLVGAGLMTAGRLVVKARRGGGLLEELQQRLLDYEHRHFADNGEGEDEDPYALEDLDDEPENLEDEPADEYGDDEYDGEEPSDGDYDEEEDEASGDEEPSGSGARRSGR